MAGRYNLLRSLAIKLPTNRNYRTLLYMTTAQQSCHACAATPACLGRSARPASSTSSSCRRRRPRPPQRRTRRRLAGRRGAVADGGGGREPEHGVHGGAPPTGAATPRAGSAARGRQAGTRDAARPRRRTRQAATRDAGTP
jgi:hypothetical protein